MSGFGRLQTPLTDAQAEIWAERVEAMVEIDALRRSARYWGLALGLSGANLDRVLIELGEPLAPRGQVPVMRMLRRAHLARQLLEA